MLQDTNENISYKDFIFTTEISNFYYVKRECLNAINSMGEFSYKNNYQQISHTDWHLNSSFNRPYINFIKDSIEKHNKNLIDKFSYSSATVGSIWFQQYLPGDYHSKHIHGNCTFTNVIMLELPDPVMTTNIFLNNKVLPIKCKEGDILSFPSFLSHSSPKIETKRKTIISYNLTCEQAGYVN